MNTQQPAVLKLDSKEEELKQTAIGRGILSTHEAQQSVAKTVEQEKRQTEFARYKQDCRKRALDLAHSQLTSPQWKQFIQDNEFIKSGVTEEKVVIEDMALTTLADKYYNWLISIPE